jgi:glycerol kinase
MSLKTLDWDDAILEAVGIPRAMLPEILPSSDDRGYGSTATGGPFGSAVPITGVLGDQQAALFGQACFDPGDVKNTYGTGCFMLLNTGRDAVASRHGLLTTVAYRLGDDAPVYALEGSVAVAGALVQWLRDNLGVIASSADVEPLARTVEDNGGVYFVPAFSGLFAPHWRADARGVIVGMTRHTNRGHIARAALEATAFQTREVLDAMRRDAGSDPRALKVDGGMVVNEMLMQFQADLLGIPVVRPKLHEATALGAAWAAGLAIGVFGGTDELRHRAAAGSRFEPRMDAGERERLFATWRKAVERTLNWI